MRRAFIIGSVAITLAILLAGAAWHPAWWLFVVAAPLLVLGAVDVTQTHHSVRRNFPIIGHGRYLIEMIRPEINQYFVESNSDGKPFSRNERSLVYQRAKGALDTSPFGTQRDVYAAGYEWINHSHAPKAPDHSAERVTVGGPQCTQKYSASIFNVSAMSYGSLSKNAVLALNGGAKLGNFAHRSEER